MAAPRQRRNDAKLQAFAQAMAKGLSAAAAAREVGYSGSSLESNAKRRAQLPSVKARVAELRERAARNTVVTIERLIDNTEEARLLAMSLEEPSAANQCIQTIAKLAGLWKDRSEHAGRDGGPIEVKDVTDAERARALVAFMARVEIRK
jgi:phage terminase small subunit